MNERVLAEASRTQRVDVVCSTEQLAAVETAWTALWHSVDGLIFQSHSWITAWWQTLPDQHQYALRIGLIWSGDRLVGVMPLAISRRKGLRFLEWAAASYTDYGDVLVAGDCSDEALQRLWQHVCNLGGFDLAFLGRLLPQATARKLEKRRGFAGVSLLPNHRKEMSYRVAGEWADGAHWFETQSKKARQNYRRGAKALDQVGGVKFRLVDADESLEPVLKRMAALKRKWLDDHALQSELFAEGTPALSRLVEAMAQAGILRIFVLESQDVIIAISINFVQRATMMAFVTTYDPEFDRASPGAFLMTNYIRWSIDHGLDTVDFLCGAEPFKNRFATRSVTLTSLMGAATIKGRIALMIDHIRHSFKTMRDRRHLAPAAAAPDDGD